MSEVAKFENAVNTKHIETMIQSGAQLSTEALTGAIIQLINRRTDLTYRQLTRINKAASENAWEAMRGND